MGLDANLLERLREAMPTDPELNVVGKFFECSFLVASGEQRFLLRVRDGQLVETVPDPPIVLPWDFAIKAPAETWEEFLRDLPPPEFQDVWAATWLGHMTLEGNMGVFMQHYLALWRTLKLLRELAGQPVPA